MDFAPNHTTYLEKQGNGGKRKTILQDKLKKHHEEVESSTKSVEIVAITVGKGNVREFPGRCGNHLKVKGMGRIWTKRLTREKEKEEKSEGNDINEDRSRKK